MSDYDQYDPDNSAYSDELTIGEIMSAVGDSEPWYDNALMFDEDEDFQGFDEDDF